MLLALKFAMQAQVVVVLNLAALQLAPAPLGPLELSYGAFDSTSTTTIVSETIRPSPPSVLGDQLASTGLHFRLGSPSAAGTAEVMATGAMTDPAGAVGAIDSVVFHAIGYITDVGPKAFSIGWPGSPATRMAWKVGAVEAQAPVISDDPAIGTGISGTTPTVGYVLVGDDDGLDPGEIPSLGHYVHTAPVLTQPNGNPWTWAAINDLHDPAIRYDWSGASPPQAFADLDVMEIWAEVFGQGGAGGPHRKIIFKLGLGVRPSGLPLGTADGGRGVPLGIGVASRGLPLGMAKTKLAIGTETPHVPI